MENRSNIVKRLPWNIIWDRLTEKYDTISLHDIMYDFHQDSTGDLFERIDNIWEYIYHELQEK